MITAPWDSDIVSTAVGGMDSGTEPELVGEHVATKLRNVSIRGGRAHSRPRTKLVATLPSGKIQGAKIFEEKGDLLISVGGKVYVTQPGVWTLEEKTDETTRGNPNRPRHWFCETQGSVIIQDFQSPPLIYDGADFRVADEVTEVPVGGPMAYANGRLAVTVGTGGQIRIGDIRQPEHQSELKFTETYFLTGGGDFSFASKVRALASLPVIDTSSGQGSLIVGSGERVSSLKTQITSRDIWADTEFQTELFPDVGITGPTAVAAVNQDLFIRAGDGLRSIRAAVADLSSPGQTPLSREVAHRFDHDTPHLLEYASVAYFDNRIFVTHSPIQYGNRGINLGLIVYNFDSLSRSGQKSAPVFDGEWDFAQIAEMVVGKVNGTRRCFVVGRDVDGANGVWEIFRESDDPVEVTESPVQVMETRALVGRGINAYKALRRCDVNLTKIKSDVNLKIYFRAGHYPFWVLWDEFDVSAGLPVGVTRPRSLQRIVSTRSAPDGFDEQTQQPYNHGFSFQVRVEWTGEAQIDLLNVFTELVTQPSPSDNVGTVDGKQYGAIPANQTDPVFWFPYSSSPNP